MKIYNRRSFIETASTAGIGIGLFQTGAMVNVAPRKTGGGKRIGIIGLDTSHSEVFTKLINTGGPEMMGYKVVAAYPHGSPDIPSAIERKPAITQAVRKWGVEIVASIDILLSKVDVVLLESNDGRVHFSQAIPVFQAGKRVFIDKPFAADFMGAKAIFGKAIDYEVPVFSSSALRFEQNVQQVAAGLIGEVIGADVYTPAEINEHHLDLAWYGIHGVEVLFSVMGLGCKQVTRIQQHNTDFVIGEWRDGRIGTIRGIREGARKIAGTAFGRNGIATLGPFTGYERLVRQIIMFFESGKPPVDPAETLEIFAFMHAADISLNNNGATTGLNLD